MTTVEKLSSLNWCCNDDERVKKNKSETCHWIFSTLPQRQLLDLLLS